MAARSIEQWTRIFEPMVADDMSEIARRILGDLTHYRNGGSYEADDCVTLGNALLAWEALGKD